VVEINLEKETDNAGFNEDRQVKSGSGGAGVTININLLGYEVREEIEKSSSGLKLSKPLLISLSLIGAAILLNVVSYFILVGLRDEEAANKEKLESRKAELANKDKELTAKQAERDILLQKRNILNWAVGNNFKWSSLLEEIRDRTPSNLWVSKLDINETYQLNISGETFDHKTVALFLANLQDSPNFTNVVLDFTKKAPTLKIRNLSKSITGSNKSVNLEVERMVTSVTKFNIRCNVVVNLN
jgi:Tfp pilus assembly protein PilN